MVKIKSILLNYARHVRFSKGRLYFVFDHMSDVIVVIIVSVSTGGVCKITRHTVCCC